LSDSPGGERRSALRRYTPWHHRPPTPQRGQAGGRYRSGLWARVRRCCAREVMPATIRNIGWARYGSGWLENFPRYQRSTGLLRVQSVPRQNWRYNANLPGSYRDTRAHFASEGDGRNSTRRHQALLSERFPR
jgi:hypothetical protein